MSDKQRIILGYFNEGKSLRSLSRATGLCRKTVTKYVEEHQERLLSRTESPTDDNLLGGVVEPPKYKKRAGRKKALTAEVCHRIDGFIELNRVHRQAGRGKQQMKMLDMHEALVKEGFAIGYTSVRRYYNMALQAGQEAFIKQSYTPGQSVEFDWGEAKLVIGGRPLKLMLATFTSAYSNYRWAMLFHRQDMNAFLEAHACFFAHIGCVPGEMVYDNMRVAVAKFACRNREKVATDDLLKLSSYYGFSVRFCNVRRGNEKGHVERSVEYLRRKAFCSEYRFDQLSDANRHLSSVCTTLNRKPVQGQKVSIDERFGAEKAVMKPAPGQPYDCGRISAQKVDKLACICIDKNHYSVPDNKVGQVVEVRLYSNHIKIFDFKNNKLLAQHTRQYVDYQYFIQLDHFLPTLLRKPGALRGSIAWKQADELLHSIERTYFSDSTKGFVELLFWCQKQGFDFKGLPDILEKSLRARPNHPLDTDVVKIHISAQNAQQNAPPPQNQRVDSLQQGSIRKHAQQQLQRVQQLFNG